jgi:hypothetical protein
MTLPSINFEADPITNDDDLWELFKTLKGRGWVGTVSAGAENLSPAEDAPVITKLDMHAAASASNDGVLSVDGSVRQLAAKVGDMKVTIGTTITALTQDTYTAMYGETV